MSILHDKLGQKLPGLREEIKTLVKGNADKVISQVTVSQIAGGLRGVNALICDTSYVDPEKGLIIRKAPIEELADKLPEEIFYLLLLGELPAEDELKTLQTELKEKSKVPGYVWDVLRAMPADSHPMVMLDTAILVMEKESEFKKQYDQGLAKGDYWRPMIDDCLTLIARVPEIAAGVYRIGYDKGDLIPSNPGLDLGANYAAMLGIDDPTGNLKKLMRLYLTLHCDHESGNVSAFTTHVVASALSDIYYAVSAGLNGLAGPLHGLANQECLNWILRIMEKYNGLPTKEQITEFTHETLNAGQVIPGYGHAVLRKTDPRFTAFVNFGKQACPDDQIFQTVVAVFETMPEVLGAIEKIKNPWPNVDAASGSLLYHFGLKEFAYYTVPFAVSRILGISAQTILSRALGAPIVRPKSISTEMLKTMV
ncbi:MAG TPA: citrate (Si)-synthase [Patescibacteria group bacterium]